MQSIVEMACGIELVRVAVCIYMPVFVFCTTITTQRMSRHNPYCPINLQHCRMEIHNNFTPLMPYSVACGESFEEIATTTARKKRTYIYIYLFLQNTE